MKKIMKRELYSVGEFPENKTVCIYGTGSAGIYLLDQLRKLRKDIVVKCFIDSFTTCNHSSGLCQICINDFQKNNLKDDLVVIASAFFIDIEATLLAKGITQYCIYDPAPKESESLITENIVKVWHHSRTHPLHLIDDEKKCFSDKSIFYISIDPMGSFVPNDGHFQIKKYLQKNNNVVGNANRSSFPKDICTTIFGQIKALNPDAVVLDACMGDFVQAVSFIERYFKLFTIPLFLIKHISKLSWHGICVPHSNWSYVYINKCGSTSFLYALREAYESGFAGGENNNPHFASSNQSILRHHPFTQATDTLFFSIVRNPYARLASIYHSSVNKRGYLIYNHLKRILNKDLVSFEDFCKFVCACPDAFSETSFKSQHSFLTTPENKFFINKIFRLEDLVDDISPINDLICKKINFHHLNKSSNKRVDYMTCYYQNNALKELVFKRYQKDFELLGYDPGI